MMLTESTPTTKSELLVSLDLELREGTRSRRNPTLAPNRLNGRVEDDASVVSKGKTEHIAPEMDDLV